MTMQNRWTGERPEHSSDHSKTSISSCFYLSCLQLLSQTQYSKLRFLLARTDSQTHMHTNSWAARGDASMRQWYDHLARWLRQVHHVSHSKWHLVSSNVIISPIWPISRPNVWRLEILELHLWSYLWPSLENCHEMVHYTHHHRTSPVHPPFRRDAFLYGFLESSYRGRTLGVDESSTTR